MNTNHNLITEARSNFMKMTAIFAIAQQGGRGCTFWGGRQEKGIGMIAPNCQKGSQTQDGRVLRCYLRRWVVERLFAWLHWFRRLVVRWESHAETSLVRSGSAA